MMSAAPPTTCGPPRFVLDLGGPPPASSSLSSLEGFTTVLSPLSSPLPVARSLPAPERVVSPSPKSLPPLILDDARQPSLPQQPATQEEAPPERPGRLRRAKAGNRIGALVQAEGMSLQALEREAHEQQQAEEQRQQQDQAFGHHGKQPTGMQPRQKPGRHAQAAEETLAPPPPPIAPPDLPVLGMDLPDHDALNWVFSDDNASASEESDGEGGRRQATDSMPGCSHCSFSKSGCHSCHLKPFLTRPFARCKPSEGRPQHVPEAPTYHPTEEEFQDPFAYIESIRDEAAKFGICRIVPPPSWNPPMCLGLHSNPADSLLFRSRKQFTSHLCMRAPNSFNANNPTAANCPITGGPTPRKGRADRHEAAPRQQLHQHTPKTETHPPAWTGTAGTDAHQPPAKTAPSAHIVKHEAVSAAQPGIEAVLGVAEAKCTPSKPAGPSIRKTVSSHQGWSAPLVSIPTQALQDALPPVTYHPDKLRSQSSGNMLPAAAAAVRMSKGQPAADVVPSQQQTGLGSDSVLVAAPSVPSGRPIPSVSVPDGTLRAPTLPVSAPPSPPHTLQDRIALYGQFLQPHPLLEPLMSEAELEQAAAQAKAVLCMSNPIVQEPPPAAPAPPAPAEPIGKPNTRLRSSRRQQAQKQEQQQQPQPQPQQAAQPQQVQQPQQASQAQQSNPALVDVFMGMSDRQRPGDADESDSDIDIRSESSDILCWAKEMADLDGTAVGQGSDQSEGTLDARAAAAGTSGEPCRADGETAQRDDGVFSHTFIDTQHSLQSFEAYSDWVKGLHFRRDRHKAGGHGGKGGKGGKGAPWMMHGAGKHGFNQAASSFAQDLSIEEIEAEFWRLVETPTAGRVVETLYGSELDSARYGSGFPLPSWRASPTSPQLDAHAQMYQHHPWNINNITRSPSSLLRYIKCDQLVTGVMVPWLHVGSCLSAFCWHIEDHSLYSINYLHSGASKVWYGVPAHAATSFEVAMRDALPHLFTEDPLLLHRLVTMLSPTELMARGVPVHKLVHEEHSFVVTFPGAYHAGLNTGFNIAEAVNFAPPDWLPFGTDVVRKYRAQGKAPTLSHDMMLCTVVGAAPLVAAQAGLPVTFRSQDLGQTLCNGAARSVQQEYGRGKRRAAAAPAVAQSSEASDKTGGRTVDGDQHSQAAGGSLHSVQQGPNGDLVAVQPVTPDWMKRWEDGVTLGHTPMQAVLLAVGELAVRVDDEKLRVAAAHMWGVTQERRMSAADGPALDKMGVYTNTSDCECASCKCDLYLSAVVSPHRPGLATCPEHASALGVEPAHCILLYRHSIAELEAKLQDALLLLPAAQGYIDAARQRVATPPVAVVHRLGPIVVLEGVDSRFLPQGDDQFMGVTIVDPFLDHTAAVYPAHQLPPPALPSSRSSSQITAGSSKRGRSQGTGSKGLLCDSWPAMGMGLKAEDVDVQLPLHELLPAPDLLPVHHLPEQSTQSQDGLSAGAGMGIGKRRRTPSVKVRSDFLDEDELEQALCGDVQGVGMQAAQQPEYAPPPPPHLPLPTFPQPDLSMEPMFHHLDPGLPPALPPGLMPTLPPGLPPLPPLPPTGLPNGVPQLPAATGPETCSTESGRPQRKRKPPSHMLKDDFVSDVPGWSLPPVSTSASSGMSLEQAQALGARPGMIIAPPPPPIESSKVPRSSKADSLPLGGLPVAAWNAGSSGANGAVLVAAQPAVRGPATARLHLQQSTSTKPPPVLPPPATQHMPGLSLGGAGSLNIPPLQSSSSLSAQAKSQEVSGGPGGPSSSLPPSRTPTPAPAMPAMLPLVSEQVPSMPQQDALLPGLDHLPMDHHLPVSELDAFNPPAPAHQQPALQLMGPPPAMGSTALASHVDPNHRPTSPMVDVTAFGSVHMMGGAGTAALPPASSPAVGGAAGPVGMNLGLNSGFISAGPGEPMRVLPSITPPLPDAQMGCAGGGGKGMLDGSVLARSASPAMGTHSRSWTLPLASSSTLGLPQAPSSTAPAASDEDMEVADANDATDVMEFFA